ncbi:amino acid ABC transporter permease [Candidatus Dependentiae bacterium]|nr:amino acid ABC transporter permease [Candidatus Dependentiae bacterium]
MITLEFLKHNLPALLKGAGTSLSLAFLAASLGFSGGTLLGIAQTQGSPMLRRFVALFVTIVRGTPMLLQIFFLDLIILPYAGIHVHPFITAVLAIGINSSAYISQVVRSGILAVPYGQIEAAQTLGISKSDLLRFVVLPQALRTILPSLGNELVTLIKDSSLASLIGVMELYQRGTIIMSQTHQALPVYIATGILYLLMTGCVSFIVNKTEKSLRHARN